MRLVFSCGVPDDTGCKTVGLNRRDKTSELPADAPSAAGHHPLLLLATPYHPSPPPTAAPCGYVLNIKHTQPQQART